MTNAELLRSIKAHKGAILAGVIVASDVIYVKVVKLDILEAFEGLADSEAYSSVKNGILYIHSGHG